MSCLDLFSYSFVHYFLIFLFISSKISKIFLPLKPWTHSLPVSPRILHRLSCSTLFPAAAMELSSYLFSPTLASRPSRPRPLVATDLNDAVDNCFCALAPYPFQVYKAYI